MKKVLFTGTGGKGGGWHMRAVQMARQRPEWRAQAHATYDDIMAADVVVLVKRISSKIHDALVRAGRPVIYDALDFWRQPHDADGIRTPEQARDRFSYHFKGIPHLRHIICVTKAMAEDLQPMGIPTSVIYHHFDPRIQKRPRGGIIRVVGYEGRGAYIEPLQSIIGRQCRSLGLDFRLIAPTTLDDDMPINSVDAVIAARAGTHASWLSRRWKSNVKAANAYARDCPLVAWPESAYLETAPQALFFSDTLGLSIVLQKLRDQPDQCYLPENRRALFDIRTLADQYEDLIESVQ